MDDIVTRLRAMVQWCENPNCEGCEVENEAIDEIERLRAEVLRLGRAYGKAVDYIGSIGDE